jgi:CBS domain-containing protein
MKRERRSPEPGDFVDPLSNYDPPTYADAFEKSLCEDEIGRLELRPFAKVEGHTSVRSVLAQMAEHNIACVVVVEDNKPIGIFSERDVLDKLADRYALVVDEPVRKYMTADPYIAYETDSPAQVLNVMGSGGFRHVPVVDVDNNVVGMVGARRMTAYLQQYFSDVESA